jgi:ribosomal protein S18
LTEGGDTSVVSRNWLYLTAKFITEKQKITPFETTATLNQYQNIKQHHIKHALLIAILYTQTKLIGEHRLNHDTDHTPLVENEP